MSLILFFELSGATPNLHNSRGLFRVLSAETHEEGELKIFIGGEILKYGKASSSTYTVQPIYVPWRVGRFDMTYGLFEPFEIYGMGLGIEDRLQIVGEPHRSGFGDLEVGAKFRNWKRGVFRVGVMGYGVLPTGGEGVSKGSFLLGERGILTLDFQEKERGVPLRFHGNLGVEGKMDEILLGVGVDLSTPLFNPIIELTMEELPDSVFSKNPIRLNSGLRFLSPFGPVFDFGYEVNLKKESMLSPVETYDWKLLLGVEFATSFRLFQSKEGYITGKVRDSETGEPLSAEILLLREERGVIQSDPETGNFVIEKVKPGLKTLQVTREGYDKKILPVLVKKGESTVREITLKRRVI